MTRSVTVSILLATLLSYFAMGCGGAAPRSHEPAAPYQRASAGKGGVTKTAARATATSEEGDSDRDGVADSMDKLDEDASGMVRGNEMAAPATTPAPGPAKAPVAAPPGEKKPEPAAQQGQHEQPPAHDTSMLIYTAHLVMAVYQVEQGLAAVEKVARDMGGYLALRRDREIVVRVPRARFEPTLAAIDKIGDVLHRDVQAQDVTDEYVDLEIRIKNARAMQVRLKQLLDKAAVKEALEIEKELRRVTEELELLEGKLKLLKDKIAYSTITVTFEARGSTIQATRIRLPFPWLEALGLPNLLQLQESK